MSKRRLIIIIASAVALVALAVALPLALMNNKTPEDSEPVEYPEEVMKAVFEEALSILEARGFVPDKIAGLLVGSDNIVLGFYGDAIPEVVEIVQGVIDEKAPGLPLEIHEHLTVEEQ